MHFSSELPGELDVSGPGAATAYGGVARRC
jgi:hypothetical protein